MPEAEKLRYKRCGTEHERRACREVIETGNACPESRAGGWGSSAGERGSVRIDSRAVREQPGNVQGFPGFVSMEVLSSEVGDEVLVITRWQDKARQGRLRLAGSQ